MSATKRNFAVRLLPSLTDVAFLLPLLLMLARMNGVKAMLCDADTGWHIRTGEWILANGRVPHQDLFSFTRAGQPWFAWEWLWDIAFAGLYRVGGLGLVALASMVVICTTSALLFRFLRTRTNTLLAMALAAIAVLGSAIHWMARPHIFTLLFAVIFLRMLERVREGAGRTPAWMGGVSYLALLPVLTVLWTNVHGGFLVGITLVGAYAAGEVIRAAAATDAGERRAALAASRPYALCAAACAAASLINPYSYQLHTHIAGYLSGSYEVRHIAEFLSLNFHHPLAPFFEIMLLLSAFALFWNLSRGRYAHCVLVAVWGHAALLATRNIPVFMMVAAPAVALAAEEFLASLDACRLPSWLRRLKVRLEHSGAMLGEGEDMPRCYAVSAAAVLAIGFLVYAPAAGPLFRPEYDRGVYPARAIESAVLANPSARIFTGDEWGDYLIFRLYPRGTRVFIDGRSDFYGEEFNNHFQDVWHVKPDWQKILARYGVDTVLLPPDSALACVLKESSRWCVVYDDGVAVVFRPASGTHVAANQVPAAERSSGSGRDREITKAEARDRTITQPQLKRTT